MPFREPAPPVDKLLTVLLLAVLQFACSRVAAAQHVLAEAQAEVHVEELPARFPHATSDEDLELLYRTGLQPDFAMHRGKQYSLADVAATMARQRHVRFYKHISLVVVQANQVHAATLAPSGTPPSPTPRRVAAIKEGLRNATLQGLQLPDCIFVLNTWDEPKCPVSRPEVCPAPVLSLIKTWDPARAASQHTDILVPFFNHMYQTVMEYPWELKQHKALMRAAIQGGMPPSNTRLALVRMSQQAAAVAAAAGAAADVTAGAGGVAAGVGGAAGGAGPHGVGAAAVAHGASLLDAGITSNQKPGLQVEVVPPVSMPDHAKWRYVISADGFTASCRLGKVLGMNSVVLKEDSRWVEHFYRALTPGTHYVPFTRHNVLQVLRGLEARPEAELQAISEAAQRFQQHYLTQAAKALYMRRVLQQYVALFAPGAHAQFVRALDPARLTDLRYLMEQLAAAT